MQRMNTVSETLHSESLNEETWNFINVLWALCQIRYFYFGPGVSYFPPCYDKILDRNNLKEEWFLLAQGAVGTVHPRRGSSQRRSLPW